MRTRWMAGISLVALMVASGLQQPARAALTICRLRYSLSGWSAFYESASGSGEITCENGQSAKVNIRAKGGGLTVGKSKVVDGDGRFSEVGTIEELYGKYASAGASAGAGDAASARVVTKGNVSLALSGTGKGFDLGFSFGEFVIEPAGAKKKTK